MLSGDVHHAYLAEVGYPPDAEVRSTVYQGVCSPYRNALDTRERRMIALARSRPAAALTGRLAAAHLGEALAGDDDTALQRYSTTLRSSYGDYFRLARGFVRLIAKPAVMQSCVKVGMRSDWLMSQLLTIMANLLRPDDLGAAEVAYRGLNALATKVPDQVLDLVADGIAGQVKQRVAR